MEQSEDLLNLKISPNLVYKKVSVVIPVYNERRTILKVLDVVLKAPICGLEKEVVLVDDCSTDGTRDMLKSITDSRVKTILKDKNSGKGASLHEGFRAATGDIVIVQDADLEYDPYEYESLIKPFMENKADVVYGSRYLKSSLRQVPKFWHTVFNKLFTLLSNMLNDLYLTDAQTCYKVFNSKVLSDVAVHLESERFGFDPEFTAKIADHKYKIMEVPVSYYPRTAQAGKHMNFKSQLETLRALFKYTLF